MDWEEQPLELLVVARLLGEMVTLTAPRPSAPWVITSSAPGPAPSPAPASSSREKCGWSWSRV